MLDSDDRIPMIAWRGEQLYNFWQDAAHPRGLWRRTTLDEYRKARTRLGNGARPRRARRGRRRELGLAGRRRCLRPGATSAAWSRCRAAAPTPPWCASSTSTRKGSSTDGFTLPEAKSDVGWIDADTSSSAPTSAPGSMTASGYPRIVKRWKRGTPLAEAADRLRRQADDVSRRRVPRPDRRASSATFVRRVARLLTRERYLLARRRAASKLDVPDDAERRPAPRAGC